MYGFVNAERLVLRALRESKDDIPRELHLYALKTVRYHRARHDEISVSKDKYRQEKIKNHLLKVLCLYDVLVGCRNERMVNACLP